MISARELIEQEAWGGQTERAHTHQYCSQRLEAAERVIEQKMAEIERQQQRIEELESSLALSQSLRHAPLIDPREAYRARLDAMVAAIVAGGYLEPREVNSVMGWAKEYLAAIDAFVAQ